MPFAGHGGSSPPSDTDASPTVPVQGYGGGSYAGAWVVVHSKPERHVEVTQQSLIGPLAKNLLGNVCHLAQCRSEIQHVLSSTSRTSQLGLHLGDSCGEASQTGREVTCKIVDLGEVKQPFPPATQVCELLL